MISKIEFYIYYGYILTNPQPEKSSNGLESQDFTEGFGDDNFECELFFGCSDKSTDGVSILVTWNDVFSGRKDGFKFGA